MMSIRLFAAAAIVGLLAACGEGQGEEPVVRTPSPAPTATTSPPVVHPAAPERSYLRVAYVNIMSPIRVDIENSVAEETYERRLDLLIAQLKAVDADVVALSEVSWTKDLGSATERLAKELRMEFQYARANPWFPGQTKEQSDTVTRQIGFEEGELLLSRYPILRAARYPLNPRTSETEGRALLHAVIQGPVAVGEVDVYVTRLSGGTEAIKEMQLISALATVARTRGAGSQVFVGDLALPPTAAGLSAFSAVDLVDVAADLSPDLATCCRPTVVGAQPPASVRTDYVFVRGLSLIDFDLFGTEPSLVGNEEPLYASDHNGLVVSLIRPPD